MFQDNWSFKLILLFYFDHTLLSNQINLMFKSAWRVFQKKKKDFLLLIFQSIKLRWIAPFFLDCTFQVSRLLSRESDVIIWTCFFQLFTSYSFFIIIFCFLKKSKKNYQKRKGKFSLAFLMLSFSNSLELYQKRNSKNSREYLKKSICFVKEAPVALTFFPYLDYFF